MSRRCSHCGHNGHNSRTCVDMASAKDSGSFKLFGVRLPNNTSSDNNGSSSLTATSTSMAMRKSFSMGNLSSYGASEYRQGGISPPPSAASPQEEQPDVCEDTAVEGYASDDLVHTNSSSRERKKGVPWTEEEHRTFLIGLQKLGKGDWRGISRNFVKTRTPTQVASHAQKYFLRRNNLNKRRRRSSLFDMSPNTVSSILEEAAEDADTCPELSLGQSIPYGGSNCIDASVFSGGGYPIGVFPPRVSSTMPMTVSEEEVNEVTESNDLDTCVMEEVAENGTIRSLDMMESVPEVNDDTERGVEQPPIQFSFIPMWPMMQGMYTTTTVSNEEMWASSKLVKPTPIAPRPPARMDDVEKLSEMSIGNSHRPVMEPSPLSYKLLEDRTRHSAFHTTSLPAGGSSDNIGGQADQ